MHLHLATIHAAPSPQAVPLAAACLKGYLDARGGGAAKVTTTCSEFYSGAPLDDICDAVLAGAPDIVGLPVYLWNRAECFALAKRLRIAAPGITIMGGGPEATADPGAVLREKLFDFLVVGEGELTVAEVMDRLCVGGSIAGIPGVAMMDKGELSLSRRPPIADLAVLPSPWLSGMLDSHIPNGVVWQLSRGCSFGCDFCYDGMGDRKVRRYPLERLTAELAYFVAHGAGQIFVLDSTFNQDVKRAKTLLRLIADTAPDIHCHFEVRHELLDEEQARLFSGLTCSLQIGLQSADPEVAAGVGRRFDRNDFVRKVSWLNEQGAVFGFDLIYGLPGDTIKRFRDGLEFALSLYPNHLDIFPLSVLPGTRVAARADSLGLAHLPDPPYTLLHSPTFPPGDMETARRLGGASDIFYSRGKAVAWFNGIVAALKMTAVSFLEAFADRLVRTYGLVPDEADLTDAEIWQLQRSFLTEIFERKKRTCLLPLALDFVDYHYHYAAAVMAPSPAPLAGPMPDDAELLAMPLRLAPSARPARFSYEILDLLESGEPDLSELCDLLERSGSWAVIYPKDGEVRTESIDEAYFNLLERLDGLIPAARVADDLFLSREDAAAFLAFALSEGIITHAPSLCS